MFEIEIGGAGLIETVMLQTSEAPAATLPIVQAHGGSVQKSITCRTRKEPEYVAIWKSRKSAFGAIGGTPGWRLRSGPGGSLLGGGRRHLLILLCLRLGRERLVDALLGRAGAFQTRQRGPGWRLGLFDRGARHGFGRAKLEPDRLLAPQLFQMVVLPDVGLHDVHHGLAAVHDDPLAIALAFHAGFGKPCVTHGIAHTGRQRLCLPVRRARGDDDPLKQGREVFRVKDLDVLRLHVLQTIHDGPLKFLDIFFGNGFSSHQAVK